MMTPPELTMKVVIYMELGDPHSEPHQRRQRREVDRVGTAHGFPRRTGG